MLLPWLCQQNSVWDCMVSWSKLNITGKQGFVRLCVCMPTSVSSISCFKKFMNIWKCRQRCYGTKNKKLELSGLLCSTMVVEVTSVYTEL